MALCKILRLECYRSDATKIEGWTFKLYLRSVSFLKFVFQKSCFSSEVLFLAYWALIIVLV